MKQLKKILVLASISILCVNLQAQNLSESETVEYIQNTFNNYRIDINKSINSYSESRVIKYNNPIMDIGPNISFNINDVYFEIEKSSWIEWKQLIIKGDANISYKNRLTSTVSFHVKEEDEIVLTRLKNAFEYLQKISGKGKSAPDPFDNASSISSIRNNSNSMQDGTKRYVYNGSIGAFSMSYPLGWEVKENPQERVRVLISAPISSGSNFRTNVNVISSKNYDSLEKLFQIHQQAYNNNRNIFVGYQLESKENVTINGISGTKVTSSYGLNGVVKVKGIQYILKKADNTMYTITFTIGLSSYEKDIIVVESIIKSFKSL